MESNMNIQWTFNNGLPYHEYRIHVDKLIREDKTTGDTQTPELLEHTKMNIQRMNRLDKTIHLPEHIIQQIHTIDKPLLWLLVGDAWCGDCAQIIPFMNKIAEACKGKINMRIISRDYSPELLETYMNGSKSVPELLIINPQTMEVVCKWGPRPKPAMDIMLKWKASNGKISKEDFGKELHLWYARDKGETTVNELMGLLQNCEKKTMQAVAA